MGRVEVGERWSIRLAELGVKDSGSGEILVQYLGKKQGLETVESNNLVGEFYWVTRLVAE